MSLTPEPILHGTVGLVTGAASDISQAIAEGLAERGVTVVLADIDSDCIEAHADYLNGQGGHAIPIRVDLSEASACRNLVDRVWNEVGPLRTLINAAATTSRGRIDQIPDEAWDQVVAVNLSSVYWTCKTAIRYMIGAGGGVIVNMGSIAGVRGLPGSPIYAATKGGVLALSRALALDHATDGIRVNVVTPPAVETRALWNGLFAKAPDPEAAKAEYEKTQVPGRMLTPAEIASVVMFLVEGRGPIYSPEPMVF